MTTTKQKKLTTQQAQEASYSELLAQTRWAKDEQGNAVRLRGLEHAELLRLLAYLEDLAPTLAQLRTDMVPSLWAGPKQQARTMLWMRTSPLYRAIATRAMGHITGLPRAALFELSEPASGRHVMAGDGAFFVGTGEDLVCFAKMMAAHLPDEHDPTPAPAAQEVPDAL